LYSASDLILPAPLNLMFNLGIVMEGSEEDTHHIQQAHHSRK
jgi:hypothetical protein